MLKMKPRYYIGIDAGTHTGIAVWDTKEKKFIKLETLKLWEALVYVLNFDFTEHGSGVKVIVEDARKRRWYGKNSNAKMQGAGSIKRDCTIWEECLTDNDIPFEMVAPIKGCTKWSSEQFKEFTKWEGRTSEHSRDAGMLVYGR